MGVVEGITEWLPVSSTGHLMIIDRFWHFSFSDDFTYVFEYVIQFSAILSVVCIFRKKITPIKRIERRITVDKKSITLWLKIIVACIPSVLAVFINDYFENLPKKTQIITVSITLIFYGIIFILLERYEKKRKPKYLTTDDISYLTAFYIGCFQVLAVIPGTSRSGITIIGGILFGLSKLASTEFTFFLAIPTMVGSSAWKIYKFLSYGNRFSGGEISALILGCVIAFTVSIFAVKFLTGFVKKHDFKPFGVYRIFLGLLVLFSCL